VYASRSTVISVLFGLLFRGLWSLHVVEIWKMT